MRKNKFLAIIIASCLTIGLSINASVESVIASATDANITAMHSEKSTDDFYENLSKMLSNYKPLTSPGIRAASKTKYKYTDFSSGRLIVKSKKLSAKKMAKKTKAAEYIVDPDGICIFQYTSLVDAKNAYNWFKKKEKNKKIKSVEIDQIFHLYDDKKSDDDFHLDDAYNESDNDKSGYDIFKNKSYNNIQAAQASHLSWGAIRVGVDEYINASSASAKKQKVVVAVIDTGVDLDHPFLVDRLVNGKNMINSGSADDDNGHGTHVAGIITDSTPGTNIKIMPVKVLASDGIGSNLTIASGINWAVNNGANVINLSLGGYTYGTDYLDSAINSAIRAGVTVCVAAGNSYGTTNGFCPAHVGDAITVAAVNSSDTRESFSNYGNAVDLACPGSGIYSSYPGGGYAYMDGTSMATPYAAACAALVLARHPGLAPAKVCSRLKNRCEDMGSIGWDQYYGEGILNMAKKVSDDDDLDTVPTTPTNPTPTNPTPDNPPTTNPIDTPDYDYDYDDFDWGDFDWNNFWDNFDWTFPYDDGKDNDDDNHNGGDDYNGGYDYNPYVPGNVSVSISTSSSNGISKATLTLTTNVEIDNINVELDGSRVKSSKFKKTATGYTLDLASYGRGNHSYSVKYGYSTSTGSFSI